MLSKLLKNKTFLILAGIFIFGLVLKLINYWDNQIFAYDQARDAQRILEILSGHIKLVGPETDIRGVFNGPLLYYLLAPFYFISSFDPNIVGLFMILVNLCGIILLYFSSILLFGKRKIGYLAAFLWTLSYEQANFARFISNASFMSITTLLFFTGLIMYFLKGKKWGLVISLVGLGMAVNFNLYLGYLILLYPILYFIYKPKVRIADIALSAFSFLFLVSPLLVAEIKFRFMSSKALIAYFLNHEGASSFISNLSSYPARMSGAMHWGFFSFDRGVALLLLIAVVAVLLYQWKRNKKVLTFLLIWLFSTLPLFFFKSGVLTAEVANTSIFGAITIAFAYVIYWLMNNKKLKYLGYLLLVVIFVSNMYLFVSNKFNAYNLFALQPLVLSEEKLAIDYTYKEAGGKDFSICAVTNPLFVNTLWSFLYDYYGKQKYGYVPSWSGQKQELNRNLLPYDVETSKQRFLIVEPVEGIADFATRATIYMEDQISTLSDSKNTGHILVEKRELNYNKGEPRDTQNLSADYLSQTISLVGSDQRYSCYNTY